MCDDEHNYQNDVESEHSLDAVGHVQSTLVCVSNLPTAGRANSAYSSPK